MRIHCIFFATWMFIASVAFGGAGSEAEKQTRKSVAKQHKHPDKIGACYILPVEFVLR